MKLLLTLGHNSSAILVDNDEVLIGYEEERLSKVKSDSAFPKLAIEKIISYFPECTESINEICIGHWFNTFDLDFDNKYFDARYIKARFPNAKLIGPTEDFTHHDLHAKSIWNMVGNSGLTIISDGFGNMEEVFSVYDNGKLVHRCYDLFSSFGLMYQYATSFSGGVENKDEYKFISYEAKVDKKFVNELDEIVLKQSNVLFEGLLNSNKVNAHYTKSEVIDIKKLGLVKNKWYSFFNDVVSKLNVTDDLMIKSVVGYTVQSILEKTMMNLINHFGHNEDGVKLCGGVFNNAKLNNLILRNVQKMDIHPLCGDQGTGLGFTDVKFDNLYWGKREYNAKFEHDGFIEVINGDLEFGSRSLLNTSVISNDCTVESSNKLNKYYGRNNLMPMAFACTTEVFNRIFDDSHKIGITRQYMVSSIDISDSLSEKELESIKGVLLYDTHRNKWTGRCQVIDDNEYVNKHGIVINTSLNAHGQPLLYDELDYKRMLKIIK